MRRCRFCGCTDLRGCVDFESGARCAWLTEDICTFCGDAEIVALIVGARLAHDIALTLPNYTPLDRARAAAWYAEARGQ